MRIGVLGPIAIDGDASGLGPRDYVVLAALTVRRGEVVSTGTLADALWGERPPLSWTKVLHGCVARLRRALGVSAIETRSRGYCLNVPPDAVDADEFERQVARGRELLALGEPDRAGYVLGEALGLWRGRALEEVDGWEPGRIEAARLDELRLEAEELRVDAALRAGRYREVLAEAQARVAEQPLREVRWTLVARAQYQAGRQSDALRTLRNARDMLVAELGLDPGPDLVALERAILRQDPALVAATAVAGRADACPYLGLVPYDVDDADTYFGRDADVAECLWRLTDAGVLAVVGPSGSGKSSLVRAGVVAALQRQGKHVVVVTPGERPMGAWPSGMTQGCVLVVDQCEEAVTLCTDADERMRFFAAMAAHARHSPVVVALRADRLGEVSVYPAFARVVERGMYLLKAMDEADLRAAIEGPARQAGLLLEPGLVDLLIRDTEGEPGALPLLSHALRQTWQRREGRALTVAGYHQTGGIRGAVAQSAEQLYEAASPSQRPVLRDLLLRLVMPSPDGEPVRNRVARRVVASGAEHERIIESLVDARLVTSDEGVVELAHEALARAWPRLRSWLDEDVEGQRILRHLTAAADGWAAMGRPDSELYRGVRLTQALEWRDRTRPSLNPAERAFLDTSALVGEREQQASRRRRRALVSGLAAGMALTTGLAAVAVINQQRADQSAERADAAADLARSRELAAAAINVIDDDPSLSKLLALASASGAEATLESISALHRAWQEDKVTGRYAWPDGPTMYQLETDLDLASQRLVASAMHDHIEVVAWPTGERLWSHTVDGPGINDDVEITKPTILGEGDLVVAGVRWIGPPGATSAEPPLDAVGVYQWNGATGEQVGRIDLGPCGVFAMAVSNTHLVGKTLSGRPEERACRWEDAPELPVELIDLHSGERELLAARSLWIHTLWWGGALSGDGRYVAYDDLSIEVAVVADVSSGEPVSTVEPTGDQGEPGVRALSQDGSLLLYGDRPMQVWDVARGEIVATFDGHSGGSRFAAFDDQTVLSTGVDGTLRRWDATTGRELVTLGAVGHGPLTIVDDDIVLVPSFWEGEAALVDFRERGEIGAVPTCQGELPANRLRIAAGLAVFQTHCAGDSDGSTHVASVVEHELSYVLPGHQGEALDISPDGTRFVRQDGDGTIHGPLAVRDLRTGEKLVELSGLCTWDADLPDEAQDGCLEYPDQPFGIWAGIARWSPDGSKIAAPVDSDIVVWDADTGRLLFTERGDDRERLFVSDVIFTPDSRHLVVSGVPDGLRVLTAEDGRLVEHVGKLHPEGEERFPSLLGYSPDGTTLIAVGGLLFVGAAGELNWLDAETLELVRTKRQIHDGAVRSAVLSSDGSRIATGSSDGFVRVWDAETGDLVHEIPMPGTNVEAVAFVDDRHLAVTSETGNLLVVTTDPDELLALVRSSLTRGFTPTECERFNFGDECPSLSDLRGSPSG